jgi:hypothetical protein
MFYVPVLSDNQLIAVAAALFWNLQKISHYFDAILLVYANSVKYHQLFVVLFLFK